MGPLIPYEIISSDWQPVIYLLIGLAFGIVLEQAGFSSSKKLTGIFYGYDFVVLKVFFTAAITAMFGLIFMQYFGVIDMDVLNINSNFLTSAIVGGVIMGFGFIIGGFCPGTSATAAAIGKIDAWVFLGGIFIGVLIFGTNEIWFKSMFENGYYFDRELIFNTIGLTRGWFVVLLVVVAIVAFSVGHYFENRAGEEWKPTNTAYSSYTAEIAIAFVLAIMVLYMPFERANKFSEVSENELLLAIQSDNGYVESDEMAFFMKHKYEKYRFVDVRSAEQFNEFSIPGSINIPLLQISDPVWKEVLDSKDEKIVLISNGGVDAAKARIYCLRAGYTNVFMLKGGLNKFVDDIFNIKDPEIAPWNEREASQIRFRKEMSEYLRNGGAVIKNRKAPAKIGKSKTMTAAGGC